MKTSKSYRQFFLFWPRPDQLRESGFDGLEGIPCIYNDEWKYEKESSDYLRDRRLGRVDSSFAWSSAKLRNFHGMGADASSAYQASGRLLTVKSIETVARQHINFLEWCEWRRRFDRNSRSKKLTFSWAEITYDDLIRGYQDQMLSGIWGTRPLAPSTVNNRVDEACFFLHWAAARSLRSSFKADVRVRSIQREDESYSRGRYHEVAVRENRVRQPPIDLIMPADDDVDTWQQQMEIEYGYTKGLMCRLMRVSGIRREECAQWRVWTLPEDKSDWRIKGETVTVTVRHGAKGQKYSDGHGGEAGPSRSVNIPLNIAEELDRYRDLVRPKLRVKYVMRGKTEQERRRRSKMLETRLFLSEYDGEAISGATLYKAWTQCSFQPCRVWHPQLMRHFWAVITLWQARKDAMQIALDAHGAVSFSSSWIENAARYDIKTLIQPQLGHINSKTVDAYLVWLRQRFAEHKWQDKYIESLNQI